MTVDAHVHVWRIGPGRYPWLGPHLAPLDRSFEFGDVVGSLDRAGVDAVVLVQADDTDADTDHMFEVADENPRVAGIVGWVPLDDPDRARARLAELRRDPRLVGIRSLIHDRPDSDWILRPDVAEGLALLAAHDLPYDYVTADPAALAHVPMLLERTPELRIVIDHLGKPPVGGDAAQRREWRALLAAIAEHPATHAKLSGLYGSRGSPADWTVDTVRPFVDDAIDLFGPRRLLAGSDWPVALTAGGHDRIWGTLTELTRGLGPADHAELFGGTATRFYGLRTPGSGSRIV